MEIAPFGYLAMFRISQTTILKLEKRSLHVFCLSKEISSLKFKVKYS